MTYQIIYDKPALKFLRKQTPEQQKRLVTAIHGLPERGDIKPMAGHPEEYRLRVGPYCFSLKQLVLMKRHRARRAARFVPVGTKHVSYGLRRAFGAIKRL